LLALRKQITRADSEGLAHVEALLALRGVHMPAVLPAKRKDVAGKGIMSAIILEALSGGQASTRTIVVHVSARRPEITTEAAYRRTTQALAKMSNNGQVQRVGWGKWVVV
jgi:hypothetical protein